LWATDLNAIAQTSAIQIVDCLVAGTLISIFASVVLGAARLQNSGTRFAVWFSALIAIAILPLLDGLWRSHAGSVPSAGTAITVPGSWALYALGAWAAISGWLLIGVGRGLWHLRVLRKSCVPVDTAELDPRLQKTLERYPAENPLPLCTSELVRVPSAIGLLNPAIVIPRWAIQELSADELNQVLLHELAHLRRRDDWTNLAQKIVKALFFFHPAVWWIEKKISLERELACDDAVIAEIATPRAYAECLTHLAEKTLVQRSVALAQAALGRVRQTSLRVARILDVNRPQGMTRAWKPAVSLVAGFAIICVLSISRAPRLISFSDGEPSSLADVRAAHVPAEMPVANIQASNAVFQNQQVRIVPASFTKAVHRSLPTRRPASRLQSPMARQGAGSVAGMTNVRLTNAGTTPASLTPVAFTETFFVVIEGSENETQDQTVYQIQLWRLTVLHPVVDISSRIPTKKI
jgi:beta-lactamase regulating signal transducer with metallopeptidase domain